MDQFQDVFTVQVDQDTLVSELQEQIKDHYREEFKLLNLSVSIFYILTTLILVYSVLLCL